MTAKRATSPEDEKAPTELDDNVRALLLDDLMVMAFQQCRRMDKPFITAEEVAKTVPDATDEMAREGLEQLERDGVMASKATGNMRIWYLHSHKGGDDLEDARRTYTNL